MSDELELLNKAATSMKVRLEHLETQNQLLTEKVPMVANVLNLA